MSEEKSRALVPATSDWVPIDSPVVPLARDYMTWSWPVLTDPQRNWQVESAILPIWSRLTHWMQIASGAYSRHTVRAWKSDWNAFLIYTAETQQCCLPSPPETVRAFLLARAREECSMATLRRLRSTIARMHVAAALADPTESEAVRLALRESAREIGTHQNQARGLIWGEIDAYVRRPAVMPREQRDQALVCLAYDASLGSEEIVNVDVEHLTFERDGSATLLLPSSKGDAEGEGAVLAIMPGTVRLLKRWLEAAGIQEKAIFRRVVGRSSITKRLSPQAVSEIFRRIGRNIGLPEKECSELSGHSARVGSTQDLFEANMDLPAIMQQGRWKDARMPARYGERLLASRGAMRQLAKRQGRA